MVKFMCLKCRGPLVGFITEHICASCRKAHDRYLNDMGWAKATYVHEDSYQSWWFNEVYSPAIEAGREVPLRALVARHQGETVVSLDGHQTDLLPEALDEWVACRPTFLRLDAEGAIECALDEHWEDAHEQVGDAESLQELMDKWVLEHAKGCCTYFEVEDDGHPRFVVTTNQIAYAIGYVMWKWFGARRPSLSCFCYMEAGDDGECPMHGSGGLDV